MFHALQTRGLFYLFVFAVKKAEKMGDYSYRSSGKGRKGKRRFVKRLVVNTPLRRSGRPIWHAFLRGLTVLPAHPAFIR